MDLLQVWETYSKYQRSWPLPKCKHEERFEEERASRLAELERKKAVRAAERQRRRRGKFAQIEDDPSSATTDPDRLSIRVVINDLIQGNDSANIEDQRKREHDTPSGLHRISQERRKQSYHDNHARLTPSSKLGRVNTIKDETNTFVSKQTQADFLYRGKRHRPTRKAKKSRSKKWGDWKEYIWQNDYDLFHSQQKNGVVNNSSDVTSYPVTAMKKLGRHSTSTLTEYSQKSEREYNRLMRKKAATVIQSAVRGWLTRHLLHKLIRKASHMDMPWRTFARDYLKLMNNVRERNLTIRPRPSLNLLDVYKYILKQEYFDEVFDSITRLILDKTSLAEFVKRCDIRVAPKDIEDSYRYVFKGVPKISVSLMVDTRTLSSSNQLKSAMDITEGIKKKLSKAAFIEDVILTTENSVENKDTNEIKVPCSKCVTNRQVTIMVVQGDKYGGFKRLYEFLKQQGIPVFLIAVGSGDLTEIKYIIPSRRTYHITSTRMWNHNIDNILEDIFKQSKQCYPMPSSDKITTQLHRREAMEIVWTLEPPPGSGCPPRKRIVSMYSIAEGMESGSLTNQGDFDFNKMNLN